MKTSDINLGCQSRITYNILPTRNTHTSKTSQYHPRKLASMANVTCPPRNQLPTHGNLPIADDVDYVLRAGTNTSDPAMTACCAPNPVNFVDGCFLWCEYPNRYSNESLTQFSACIIENGGEEAALAGSLPDSATSTGAPSMMALALAILIFSLMSSA